MNEPTIRGDWLIYNVRIKVCDHTSAHRLENQVLAPDVLSDTNT